MSVPAACGRTEEHGAHATKRDTLAPGGWCAGNRNIATEVRTASDPIIPSPEQRVAQTQTGALPVSTQSRDLSAERLLAEAVTRAEARARSFVERHPAHDLAAVTASFTDAARAFPADYLTTTAGR